MLDDPAGELQADCERCPVRALVLYRFALDRDPKAIQHRRMRMRHIPARGTVLGRDEPTDEFCTLYSGWAVRYRVLADGSRQVLGVLLPGDPVCLPLLSRDRVPFTVEAVTAVQLCVFRREDLIECMREDPEHCLGIVDAFRRELLRADDAVIDMGRRSAAGRMARFVVDLYGRLAERGVIEGGRIPFPLRQRHLADALGISTVHLHRTLNDFRTDGVLEIRRDVMIVRDLRALVRVAGYVPEEYRAALGV